MKFKLPNIFKRKPKNDYLAKLELAFEHKGVKYYRFHQKVSIPASRFIYVDQLLELRSLGLSGEEMDKILTEMESALVMDMSKPSNIARIGHLIECIKQRRSLVLHRDILINMAAYMLIREDEDPVNVHKGIHDEKVELFESLAEGGEKAYDFFMNAALKPLSELQKLSKEEFTELWENNTLRIVALKKTLKRLSSTLTK